MKLENVQASNDEQYKNSFKTFKHEIDTVKHTLSALEKRAALNQDPPTQK